MISEVIQSQFNDLKPMNKACVQVVVEFQQGLLMETLAEKLKQEFDRMSSYSDRGPISELTANDLLSYLSTLFWMRVADVNQNQDKTALAYRPVRRTLAIPVLFYQILVGVGKPYDKDYNLEFVPEYKISQEQLLSPVRMSEISNLFRQFENSGMKIVFGLPNDTSGELDFMAMSHVNSEVVSYRKCHPVYGFLAAFVAQQELNKITGTMSRVFYGYESDFNYRIDVLMSAINHADRS
jgi:hypothetical protein